MKTYFLLKGICFYGNKKIILYSTSIEEAIKYNEIIVWLQKLLKIEVDCNVIDCNTSKLNRIQYIKNFKNNQKNTIFLNVQILNEGIDIPECDSIYITKPNDNIINLIQCMCRCNRILPNKKTCNIFLWCRKNKTTKIFDYFNNNFTDELVIKNIIFFQI